MNMEKRGSATHQVGVSSVQDGQKTDSEELTGSRTELDVTTLVVVDGGLGPKGELQSVPYRQQQNIGCTYNMA